VKVVKFNLLKFFSAGEPKNVKKCPKTDKYH